MKATHNLKPLTWPGSNMIFQTDQTLLNMVTSFENLGTTWPVFADIYAWLFYKNMVAREIALSGITPDMTVLHVGCGPLPITAVFLARFGVRVTAVDVDADTVKRAEKVITRARVDDRITLAAGCGTRMDFSGYQAIWLSLHVKPMDRVIERAVRMMDDDAGVIYRAPRGSLARFYRGIGNDPGGRGIIRQEIRQSLGKKSILLKKA